MGGLIYGAVILLMEAFTAWEYMKELLPGRRRASVLPVTMAAGYLLLAAVYRLDMPLVSAAAFCGVNFLLIRVNYVCPPKTALFHAGLLCFIRIACEGLVKLEWVYSDAALLEMLTYPLTNTAASLIMTAFMRRLPWLALCLCGAGLIMPDQRERLERREPERMGLFCALPLLSALMAGLLCRLAPDPEAEETLRRTAVTGLLGLLAVNFLFLVAYRALQDAAQEQLALELSIQKGQADAAYYQALQEQYENQRVLVHDIRKHLRTIDGLARSGRTGEIEAYISKLDAALASPAQAKLCGDPILNLILLRFRDDCKACGVDFRCDVRDKCTAFMDAAGVTSLYGNLLSNALEAAVNSRGKQIELSVRRIANGAGVLVAAVNSCDTAPVTDRKGRFITQKRDRARHGVGMRSIERTVQKYGGISNAYYEREEALFHHVIHFPLPEEEPQDGEASGASVPAPGTLS